MENVDSVASSIKDQLIARIEGLDSVQLVLPSNRLAPSGWPCVFITTSDLDGEFASSSSNSRVFGYKCVIAFPVGADFLNEAQAERLDFAERVLNKVLQDILNSIETDFELDGPPTLLYTEALDCVWGEISVESGIAQALEVTIRCYTEVEII